MKSLKKSQFIRYFFYAIGEIILVVIGILIALEVDNYSKENELKQEEIEILEQISDNLKFDLIDLNYNLTVYKEVVVGFKEVSSHLIQKKQQNRRIDSLFIKNCSLHINAVLLESGFNSAKSKGLQIISNKNLRSETQALYEFWYPLIIRYQNGEFKRFDHFNDLKSCRTYINLKEMRIDNYEVLISNNKVLYTIKTSAQAVNDIMKMYESIIKKNKGLTEKIDNELEQLKKASQN